MILIVSPNLCLDRIVTVSGFRAGAVWRADDAVEVAGGKGMNVARALNVLGEPAIVIGFTGGETGRGLREHARAEGLALDPVEIAGATRVCTHILDPDAPETVINERGPTVAAADVARLRAAFAARLGGAAMVILTGSVPPGCPPSIYEELAKLAAPRPVLVDATDAALRHAMRAAPTLAKLNRDELRQTFAVTAASPADAAAAARGALDATSPDRAAAFVVTLGSDGAVLVAGGGGAYHVAAPHVRHVNSIGAGDALTAGLATGVRRGWTWDESLRFAVAVAASDVETIVPGMPSASRAEALRGSLAAARLA